MAEIKKQEDKLSSVNRSPFSEEKLEQIRREMSIAEAVEQNPELAERLTDMGFGCVGCSCSDMETLEDGIAGHGLDVEEVMKELNKPNNKNEAEK